VEILLITGRSSARWSIPKGWPMLGKTLAEAAAQEAVEEAGVEGRIMPEPIGRFTHTKRHSVLGHFQTNILVHPLAVERELAEWPERRERTRRWFSREEASHRVASEELASLIRSFVPDAG
jgi:8-oxo-dGTP pyrophosphatase MutT (NUDIX family)